MALAIAVLLVAPHRAHAFEIEKVSFDRLDDDLVLTAFFSKPDTPPPHPAIVFLHGCSGVGLSGSLSPIYSTWMRHFGEAGFATLTIDSATPRGFASTCGKSKRRRVMYLERPGDAYSGLYYLQSRNDIEPGRIGLMGWSQGGGITLLTVNSKSIGRPQTPDFPDFAAAIALYPSACSSKHQSRPYTTVEPGTWATVAPLLVLHGEKDNWTPAAPCKDFIENAGQRGQPVDIIVYPEAAHSFDAPNIRLGRRTAPRLPDGSYPLIGTDELAREDAMARASDFFLKQLD